MAFVFNLVHNWVAIWTAGSQEMMQHNFELYFWGTFPPFGVFYLVWFTLATFTKVSKPFGKLVPYVIGAHAIILVAPIALPIVVYGGLDQFIAPGTLRIIEQMRHVTMHRVDVSNHLVRKRHQLSDRPNGRAERQSVLCGAQPADGSAESGWWYDL